MEPIQQPERSTVFIERVNDFKVEKSIKSEGKLFQTFMTRSAKNTDLEVLLQWCLNNL